MRNYVPYFESIYYSIIPFEQVGFINEIQAGSGDKYVCTITTTNGSQMKCFTFKSIEDMKDQMNDYKEYLITKYRKKELTWTKN